MYHSCRYNSPLGELTLASDGEFLTGLWLPGQKHFARNHSDPTEDPGLPVFQMTAAWLDRYFAGDFLCSSLLPLKPEGTHFQQKVWGILMNIPHTHTVTYGQIAKMLGNPGGAQAVGAAVGRNPISIIIPCHRVLGAGGKLTGYAGGIPAKIWLLRHEGHLPEAITDWNLSGIVL